MPTDTGVEPRTFYNDPHPPPKAPAAGAPPAPSAAPEGASSAGLGEGAAAPGMTNPVPAGAFAPPKRLFTVVNGKEGRSVFVTDDTLTESLMGAVSAPDADKVLDTKGTYNPISKTWDVPEDVAMSLTSGRLAYPDYLMEKFEEGEAGVVRSLLGQKVFLGEMTPEDALERGHMELLKVRVGTEPALAWRDGFGALVADVLKRPAEVFRMASGEVMRNLPDMMRAQVASARGAAAGLAVTAPALLTGPVGVPAFMGMASTGAAFSRWRYFVDSQTGTIMLDSLEKKHDPATARALAEVGGVINGTLETIGFDLMTASVQRQALKVVFSQPAVRKAVSAFVTYGKGVAGETGTELAQTKVEQWLDDVAADIDTKPGDVREKAPKYQKRAQLWETFVKTVMSAGLIAAPGAALDVAERKAGEKKGKEGAKAEKAPAEEPQKALPAPQESTPTAEKPGSIPAEPAEFPKAGDIVDGRTVRADVPNTSSIASSLTDYEVLPGIREVPVIPGEPKFYSTSEEARTRALAEEIKESGEISPLILVLRPDGTDDILEGAHRYDALRLLGAKSFPALVVRDMEAPAALQEQGPGALIEQGTPEQAAQAMIAFDEEQGLLPFGDDEGGKGIQPPEKGLVRPEGPHLDPVVVSWIDRFLPDPHLAAKNQIYGLTVHTFDAARAQSGEEATAIRHALMELGEDAQKSRERGLGDKLAPTMPEVMAYLEAETPEAEAAAFAKLTPEEKKLGQFVRRFLDRAYDYLQSVEGMESRFADAGYFPHMVKPVSEILRSLPEKGWAKTLGALLKRWDLVSDDMSVRGPNGEWVPRNKFFKHALFRSGELDPSQNVVKVVDHYLKQLAVKKAVDQAQPIVHGMFQSFASMTNSKDPAVQQANKALLEFLGDYMNNQKGHSVLEKVVPQGSAIDLAFRAARSWISFLSIAGNYPLQALSIVGEAAALSHVVGPSVIALGQKRALTDEGKAFLKRYESFVGTSALREAKLPGANFEDKMGGLLYGLISFNRTKAAEVAILGSLSEKEFRDGTISAERQANLKQTIGLGVDLPGNKSIFGSTSVGTNLTQFRGWAIPIALTTSQDLKALGKQFANMGDPNMRVTEAQRDRLLRAAAITAVAVMGLGMLGDDPKDKTPEGRARRKLLQEMFTLTGALDPRTLLTVGPSLIWVMRMGAALRMLIFMEEYKHPNREKGVRVGDSRGWVALKRANTMGAWRVLNPEKKKKR